MIPILASAGLTLLITLFVFVCFMLIVVVLVQKPAGGGLVGAFGGAGGVQDFLGTKMGSKITWFTVVLFALFILLACVLTIIVRPDYTRTGTVTPTPAATAPADDSNPAAPAAPAEAPATSPASEKTP